MKKVFDQTVRDIKREVNKKVLKVPGIEQKVLDATSNEPWGPHGTLLADIAQASRNYHDYQLIMTVIWKRINDTGKNWRHVYKGLTVLDYLVANGSERVIDDIKEHAYQISTLSSFHYIDSSGRDQGNNVRKKSQSLVDLVNDKERIIEVRQKAAANREKYRSSPGGMHRPSSYGNFDEGYDGRYGYRDDDRNGRDRDYNYRGDRYGDKDRHSTEYEDRYSYRDEDYRGRSRSVGDLSVRSRSSDRDNKEDDAQFSSRGLERKYSEQNIGAPPSYEDAVGASPTERNSELPPSGSSSPAIHNSSAAPTLSPQAPPADAPVVEEVEAFDEFDPRGPVSVGAAVAASPPPPAVNSPEMDLLGSLSDSFLAIVPVQPTSSSSETPNLSEPAFGASLGDEDPFGDSPFKAIPVSESNVSSSTNCANAEAVPTYVESFSSSSPEANHQLPTGNNDIDILAGILPSTVSPQIPPTSYSNSQIPASTFSSPQIAPNVYPDAFSTPHSLETSQQNFIPQPHPSQNYMSQPHPSHNYMPQLHSQNYMPQPHNSHMQEIPSQIYMPQPPDSQVPEIPPHNFMAQPPNSHMGEIPAPQNFTAQPPHSNPEVPPHNMMAQPTNTLVPEVSSQNYMPQPPNANTQLPPQNYIPQALTANTRQLPPQNYMPQSSFASNMYPHTTNGNSFQQSGLPLAVVPQLSKDKFETKSTVWSDTLSRGLVNLNISGPKTNPLADIGVDFDSINRKEKRFEKQPAAPATSTVTMGKAMGTGSGIGRAGAGAMRPQQPPNNPYGAQMRPQQPPNNPYGVQMRPQQPMYPQNNPYAPQTRPPYGYPQNTTPNPYAGYR